MIRIEVNKRQLLEAIRVHNPTWLERAANTREANRAAGCCARKSPSWSQIKAVYVRLQHRKCAYCERQLSAEEEGPNEWDVEHFRPKAHVTEWIPSLAAETDYSVGDLGSCAQGYYLLSHHPHNYVVACKVCNSNLKGNLFPIEGTRQSDADDPSRLAKQERPYLIYPLGRLDTDPESLIRFDGLLPIPVACAGYRKRRALATIDVFELAERRTLDDGRAESIVMVWFALEQLRTQQSVRSQKFAQQILDAALSGSKAHTSCARAFHAVYNQDRGRAKKIAEFASEIYSSKQ